MEGTRRWWSHFALTTDVTVWQVLVLAADGGSPALTDTTVVEVHVNRNLHAPRMRQDEYTARILETQPLGSSFLRLEASDADQKVSSPHLPQPLHACHQRQSSV